MKATEFCYWLQGYFEIGGENQALPATLQAEAVACIRNHLALVAKCDAGHENLFVSWLALKLRDPVALSTDETAEIRRLLARQFKHEIDPSYGGDAAELQAIHDGPKPRIRPNAGDGREPVYRC